MKEDQLYCEQCGEDIHIVPDFEPELEYNLEKTLSGIVEEIREKPEPEWEKEEAYEEEKPAGQKRQKAIPGIVISLLALLLAGLCVLGVWMSMDHSLDYQLQKARQYVETGEYDRAVRYYNRALELEPENISLKFELAELYYRKNNKIEYEYLLRDIVKDSNTDSEQMESAYGKLVAIYREKEDYQTINDLLIASNNENIMSAYQNYLALRPEFSITEGYYTSIQPLKLSALSSGKIFFSLDGADPVTEGKQYTAPILLENGDYIVSAVFVNDNGVQSEVVTKEYHIQVEELPIPEVTAVSGEYQFPINISIDGDRKNIYYTTDGTTPTENSTQYVSAIPMPLGKSTFQFIRIADGRSSQVVEKTYQLVLNTELQPTDAERIITEYVMSIGKIREQAGYFDDTTARYVYQYQYVTNINRVDDFYVIAEILVDAEEHAARTGSFFAVNVYNGSFYRLNGVETGSYELQEIESSTNVNENNP